MQTWYPAEHTLLTLLRAKYSGSDAVCKPSHEKQVLTLAHRHRVTNLLSENSFTLNESKNYIKGSKLFMLKRQLLVASIIARVRSQVGKKNLPLVLVRGADAATRLYKESERSYSDIDLLVEGSKLSEYLDCFQELGFCVLPNTLTQDGVVLYSREHEIQLDVHANTFESSDTSQASMNNISYECLADSALLVHLAEHGAKHLWCRLLWVLDVALLVRTMDTITLEKSLHLAEKRGSIRKYMTALALVDKLFDCANPLFISYPKEIDACVQNLCARMFLTENSLLVKCRNVVLRAKMEDSTKARHTLLFSRVLRPTPQDKSLVQLPSKLAHFYPFVRSYRILRQLIARS